MSEEIEVEAPEIKPKGFVVLAPGTIASDFSLQHLNEALGEAQNEFKPAEKNEKNEYVGYKYVPLESIIAAVRPALTKHRLTVSQFPVTNLEEKTIAIHTRLVHWDSGEWIQNELIVPAELALGKDGAMKFNQQTIGGSQTYAQKYAYKAILGIPDSEEIIDGSEDGGRGSVQGGKKRTTPAEAMATRPTTTAQSAAQQEQRAASSNNAQAQPQAGQLRFIPPNGLTCTVKGVQDVAAKPATADRKAINPYVTVTFLGTHNGVNYASCFDSKYWELLKESVGLECHFQIDEKDAKGKHYLNIVDVLYVDGTEYVDGRPIPPPEN